MLATRSCSTLCDPMDWVALQTPLSMGILQARKRVGCHSPLQGIFPTEGLNPGLLHCRWILYHLSHQEAPKQAESSSKKKSQISQITSVFCSNPWRPLPWAEREARILAVIHFPSHTQLCSLPATLISRVPSQVLCTDCSAH